MNYIHSEYIDIDEWVLSCKTVVCQMHALMLELAVVE
jgi:hypothetical protein